MTESQPTARAIVLGNGTAVVVDEADYALVSPFYWHAHRRPDGHGYYARATVGSQRVFMHTLLMGKRDGFHVDHKNGNGLDNRRDNLR